MEDQDGFGWSKEEVDQHQQIPLTQRTLVRSQQDYIGAMFDCKDADELWIKKLQGGTMMEEDVKFYHIGSSNLEYDEPDHSNTACDEHPVQSWTW